MEDEGIHWTSAGPRVILTAVLLIGVAALVAVLVPARAATRVDPLLVLRADSPTLDLLPMSSLSVDSAAAAVVR
ncbi:MAG: hypothetical protein HYU53_04025 [Acidobacteria bacterium]|nr:hypothetical protein [Acidobacteriota bacterium]